MAYYQDHICCNPTAVVTNVIPVIVTLVGVTIMDVVNFLIVTTVSVATTTVFVAVFSATRIIDIVFLWPLSYGKCRRRANCGHCGQCDYRDYRYGDPWGASVVTTVLAIVDIVFW